MCLIRYSVCSTVQDHLLPEAYVTTMREHALDKCPVSSYEDVCRTFSEDLGALPEDLFATFEKEPFASASLAQVHRATTSDGQHLAVKIQHAGLREHCDVDTATIECGPPLRCHVRARAGNGSAGCTANLACPCPALSCTSF